MGSDCNCAEDYTCYEHRRARWFTRCPCVQCGHDAVAHAVDDEERRECNTHGCDCKQFFWTRGAMLEVKP